VDHGDINGDNIDDAVVVGANGYVYVLFGTRSGFPVEFDLNNADGINGFRIKQNLAFKVSCYDINVECLHICTRFGNFFWGY